jgi:hypothetical protein
MQGNIFLYLSSLLFFSVLRRYCSTPEKRRRILIGTMTIRTTRTTVTFRRPFSLTGTDRIVPAGSYPVVTDEELIDGLSFLAYRRVLTAIYLPVAGHGSSIEMLVVDPQDLDAAQDRDRTAPIP